jgi:peptidyl-prolyl cis-trans isomerase D
MLEMLRRGAAKVLVFALFSILIISFAIWGIGDVIRTGGQGPIAEVGPTSISPQEFTAALQHRRQLLTRQLGQPLTPEQSRAFGIDAAVLSELVNGAAISNHAKSLGLRLSDQTIADLIRSDPVFQGPDRTFSRAVFDERIRQVGYTEQRYFAERRSNEVREQLTEALVAGIHASDSLIGIVHRYREETRAIAFARLDPEKVAKPGDPDEKALRALYDEQKRVFTLPERRKIAVLLVTPDQLRDRAKVSDEEVRASWEQSRPAWDIPERRRIQQIFYKTKAEAEGEAKAIAEGKSFLMAALEADPRAPLDRGLVARREIADANFAKAAFELPVDKLSEPVQVRGGFLLLRVTAIEPARTRTFEEVKPEVRQALEDTKLRDIAGKLHDEIEDKRGATDATEKLKAIAAELKLPLIEAAGVDAKGSGADGKPAFTHSDAEKFIATAFEGDKTTPREVISLADGGEAWVEVVDITPAVTKPFEEVKAEVEKMWRDREVRSALSKQAQALIDRVKSGETLATIAKEIGVEVTTSKAFKRTQPPEGLSPAAARQAFTLARGGAGSAATPDDKTRIVFVVTDIKPAEAPTKEQAEALKNELGQELQNDALQTYVSALRERQGVKIHEAVYKRTVGLETTQ